MLGFLFGLGAAIGYRKYRRHALLIAILWTFFLMAAVMVSTFHVSPRHLVGVLPLACVLIWPGLDVIARLLPLRGPQRDHAALGLGVLLLVLPLMTTIRVNRSLVVPDSRTAAYRWIVDHLPADAGILVEDEGPVLQPSAAAVSRMQATLRRLPEGSFTIYEDQRLRLLERFPANDGRDIWLLGHPWWLPAERPDEEIKKDLSLCVHGKSSRITPSTFARRVSDGGRALCRHQQPGHEHNAGCGTRLQLPDLHPVLP